MLCIFTMLDAGYWILDTGSNIQSALVLCQSNLERSEEASTAVAQRSVIHSIYKLGISRKIINELGLFLYLDRNALISNLGISHLYFHCCL